LGDEGGRRPRKWKAWLLVGEGGRKRRKNGAAVAGEAEKKKVDSRPSAGVKGVEMRQEGGQHRCVSVGKFPGRESAGGEGRKSERKRKTRST